MPDSFGSSEHWHMRAREARKMAETFDNAEAKEAMLDIAENYEKIAKRAEAKEAHIPFASHGRPPRDA